MSTNTEDLKEEKKPEESGQTEKVKTDEAGLLKKLVGRDGKEHAVVNSVTLMELVVHKLDSGEEVQQLIAHEFMMVDHKTYLVKQLTKAIDTVMEAKKRKSLIHLASKAMVNKVKRLHNRSKGGAFGGKIIT